MAHLRWVTFIFFGIFLGFFLSSCIGASVESPRRKKDIPTSASATSSPSSRDKKDSASSLGPSAGHQGSDAGDAGKVLRPMEGEFYLYDGSRKISLGDRPELPVVLFFAAEICRECIEEAKEVAEYLGGATPTKVRLYTLLVGFDVHQEKDRVKARKWAEKRKVTWTLGIDQDRELMRKYCKEQITPCTVIHLPHKGTVVQVNAKVHVKDILEWTGPWN